jgi:hypothetical protein
VCLVVIFYGIFGLKDLIQGRSKRKTGNSGGGGGFASSEDITYIVGNVMGKIDWGLDL